MGFPTRRRSALRPACLLLPVSLALSACAGFVPPATPQPGPVAASPPPTGPRPIALLLPLTGPRAELAQSLLMAVQLAFSTPGAPPLDVRDTGGDPGRAAEAATAAIAAGDALILGPLTAEETITVTGVAVPATTPVLSFSSDSAAASPGVWTLGVTPGQQMQRLIAAARDDGRQRIAAILPQGAFGDALQTALTDATAAAGLEAPNIQRSDGTLNGFTEALKTVSNYEQRRGELQQRLQGTGQSTDPDEQRKAAMLAAQPVQPPPFDALLLGDSGDILRQAADELSYYDVTQPQTRLLGTALLAPQSGRLGRLAGAWFAALDLSARPEFVQAYQAKFGQPPPPFADLAFDSAAIARVIAQGGDFSASALARPEGFSGVDGALVLLPDGHVRRALAVYEILPHGGGAKIVSPAPQDLTTPGS
jgi:branched-chain amino acid transport system substrate-binding protein